MIIFFGTKSYGKVDSIPGVCHVATDFVHIQFLPLIPVGTYAVFSDRHRVRLPLSFKSILMAWLRVFLMVSGVAAALFSVTGFAEHHSADGILAAVVTAAILCLIVLSYRLRSVGVASESRTRQLANLLQGSEGIAVNC